MKTSSLQSLPFFARTTFIIVASLCAGFLLAYSLRNALLHSQDFQWSGARAVMNGIDPFREYLSGNRGLFIKSQAPNYLHIYYLFLLPFAFLPAPVANLAWGLCNILMLGLSIHLLLSSMGVLSQRNFIFITTLFLSVLAFPARNAIGNGQASIFVLLTISLGSWLANLQLQNSTNKARIAGFIFYGFSYVKYSFMPMFAAFLLFKKGILPLIISLIPITVGIVLFVAYYLDPTIIWSPLLVSQTTMLNSYGMGDLLSVINMSAGGLNSFYFKYLGYTMIAVSFAIIYLCRNYEWRRMLAITTLVSLMFVTHLGYDYVLLIILLVFGFSPHAFEYERTFIVLHFLLIGVGIKFLDAFSFDRLFVSLVVFCLNLSLLTLIAARPEKANKFASI